jgi:hypothetical protein
MYADSGTPGFRIASSGAAALRGTQLLRYGWALGGVISLDTI